MLSIKILGVIDLVEIKKELEKMGSVAEVEKEKVRSFDIAFAEERAYLIKVVGNVESFTKEQAEALKKSASVANAEPLLLSKNAKEGIIYRRHGVPVMEPKTFITYLRGGCLAVADRGCVKVPVKNVREIRERKGISRKELAKALGVSVEMVRRYEEGKAYPSKEIAEKMVKMLGSRILDSLKFKTKKVKRAFIGKGPFEIGIRKRKPILISLKDTKIRLKNLERVSEVLKAKPVVVKEKGLDEIFEEV